MQEFVGKAPALRDGCDFGPYAIEGRHPIGRLADLWRARLRSGNREERRAGSIRADDDHVLLTTVPRFAWDRGLAALETQARSGRFLQHQNVVGIVNSGRTDECHFVALEYVEGPTLRGFTDSHNPGSIPLDFVLRVSVALCEALEYLHAWRSEWSPEGLVHGDLTLDSILVCTCGDVKLLPLATDTPALLPIGAALTVGGCRTAAPEALRGESLDRTSNVFSVGAILYELLGLAKRPRPLIDPRLATIVRRALADRPDDRPRTAAELQSELLAFARATGLDLSGTRTTDRDEAAQDADDADCARIDCTWDAMAADLDALPDSSPHDRDTVTREIDFDPSDLALVGARPERQESLPTLRPPPGTEFDRLLAELRTEIAEAAEAEVPTPPPSAPEPEAAPRPALPAFAAIELDPAPRTASIFDVRSRHAHGAPSDPFDRRRDDKGVFDMWSKSGTEGHAARPAPLGARPPRSPPPVPPPPIATAASAEERERHERAARHFEDGWRLYRQGEYERALSEWESAAALHPEGRAYEVNVRQLRRRLVR